MDEVISSKGKLHPYLLVSPEAILLVVDGRKINGHAGSADDYPLLLVASYFIYNIEYVKGCNNFYTFFELLFFEETCNHLKLSATVKNLYTVFENM